MKYLIVLLLSSVAFAETPQQWTPWPANGTLYLLESACPKPCYPLLKDGAILDVEVLSLRGGVLSVDPAKQAAKLERLRAEAALAAQKAAEKAAAIQRLKDADPKTMDDAKALFKDVSALLKEMAP